MNFNYSFNLPVSLEKTWTGLNDFRRVAPCMPGAAIESGESDHYTFRMKVKVGPISMTYKGDMDVVERNEAGHRLKIEAAGTEIRGGGKTKALVTLLVKPAGDGCEVTIDADYHLSGKAAQFGTGMINEIGGKLMRDFAARLEKMLLKDDSQTEAAADVERGSTVAGCTATGESNVAPTSNPENVSVSDTTEQEDEEEALNLVGLAFGIVVKRALPGIHFLVSVATLLYVITD